MAEYAAIPMTQFSLADALTNAQTINANQQKLDLNAQLAPIQVENAQQQTEMNKYALQGEKQKAALEESAYNNAQIAAAAQKASAAPDPESAWDEAMQGLQDKGIPGATQFIGRYTPVLAERVSSAYSNDAGGASGPATVAQKARQAINGPVDFDKAFAGLPPEKLPDVLERTGTMMDSLSKVRNAQDWEAMKAAEVKAGFPGAASLGPYNPLTIPKLYDHLLGQFNYLQGRVVDAASGRPAPSAPYKLMNVGGVLQKVTDDGTGNPQVTQLTQKQPTAAAAAATTPGQGLTIDGAWQRMQVAENSSGNPAAKNPNSTATGNGQFIDKTWMDTVNKAYPDLSKQMSKQEILDLRKDPGFSEEMGKVLTHQNAVSLMDGNHPVTSASLYTAHRFGAAGADKILNALPATPIADVVGDKVMTANPDLAGKTVGQVMQNIVQKVGNDPVATEEGTEAAQRAGGLLTDNTARGIAQQVIAGDPHALTSLGQGKVGSINKAKVQEFVDQGLAANGESRSDLAARQATFNKTEGNFASGVEGRTIRSVNAAMAHLDVIRELGNALQNGDVQAINSAKNRFSQAFGGTAPATFEALKPMVATEVAKAILSSGGGIADREEFKDALTSAQSPQQLAGVINGYQGLFGGQLQAFKQQYQHGTGRKDFDSMLTPETKAVLDRMSPQQVAGGAGGKPQFQNGTVYKDKNGNQARYNNGKWIPV